jgi:hypothetical protein
MSTNAVRTTAERESFRAHEETPTAPRWRFEDVDAFSRDRLLELLVHLTHDGYSITLFDWLATVPEDLQQIATGAFRTTETPSVFRAGPEALVEYVERLRAAIRRRMEMRGPKAVIDR